MATKQPEHVGCMACRRNAVFWNREMRSLAQEDLTEAASLTGPSGDVNYVVAAGRPVHALGEVADRSGADMVVLPAEPSGGLCRLFSSSVAQHLRQAGRWEVIVAPAEAPRSNDDASVGTQAGAVGSEPA